jgi:hypothetical protein
MEEEIESIRENKTWIFVDLPKEKAPIIEKWVFKTKIGNIRKVDRLKTKLVVRGCE